LEIPRDALWSENETNEYITAFTRTGFPLNWYRAMDLNFEWDRLLPTGFQVPVPCLMVSAEYDAVLTPEAAESMQQYFELPLERKLVSCGHWTPVERKAELNAILVEFLTRRFPNAAKKAKM
jgi:pimeloyl-ACP methyl ester carboxylesterase